MLVEAEPLAVAENYRALLHVEGAGIGDVEALSLEREPTVCE
jgi:hypothetical protein